MLHIEIPEELIQWHVDAVMNRLKKNYRTETVLENVKALGVDSIEEFLTADVERLRSWIKNDPNKLQFVTFKEIYSKYFSNGSNTFVYGNYNAYKFLEHLNVNVCPYCDDEYLHNDLHKENGNSARTSEVDHFFPKSKYPALAMCIYNLVPSGQNCNGLKREQLVGENPYETEIENDTWLCPDLEMGRLMETLTPEACKIYFHPKHGMKSNVTILCLEERYELYKEEVYRILKNKQIFTEEKINEISKMFEKDPEDIYESIFGSTDPKVQRNEIHGKMKRDLLGSSAS